MITYPRIFNSILFSNFISPRSHIISSNYHISNLVPHRFSIICDVTNKDSLNIPCILRGDVEKFLYDNPESTSTILYPVRISNNCYYHRSTASIIVRDILSRGINKDSIISSTERGTENRYYGNSGILLYGDTFTPALLTTLECKFNPARSEEPISIIRPCLYISNEVFKREDKVSKFIRGKFLNDVRDFYYNNENDIYTGHVRGMGSCIPFKDISIIMGNEINKFFVYPTLGNTVDNNNIYEFLNSNKESISNTTIPNES